MNPARRLPVFAGLLPLLALAWLAYLPGLSGGFLFDDFINLPALGATGSVDDWATFWRYVTSGFADPTGRPLALLSFLVDARNWPAEPGPFLRTNVLLHLLNGALLFALLRALGRHLDGTGPRTDAAALLGAGMWLLHPLWVSTTLYIVQREAMLPATFILLGLLAWLHGRTLLPRTPRAGTAWMLAGIGVGTALAVLGKANGVLLPLLAWTLEATVLGAGDRASGRVDDPATAQRRRRLHWLLLVLPSLALLAWLASFLPRWDADLTTRPWTIGERLLTEPRVLMDYLRLLWLPRVLSSGVYNDAYTASIGLMAPVTTLPALLAVAALLALGFAARRSAPALAAALLFFFAGHLLESTVIALELYFEHRNYLPAMLMFWPLARVLCRWRVPLRARVAGALVLVALLAATTWQRAALWGQPERMALLWAAQNPTSSRAQATAASTEARAGGPALAMARLGPLWQADPHDLQLALNYANAACAVRGLQEAEIAAIGEALRRSEAGDQLVHRWLGRALDAAAANACRNLDLHAVDRWLAAARANPHLARLAGRRQDLHGIAGRLALQRGLPDLALAEFDQGLAADPKPDVAMAQAALLATHGHYRQALAHLDHFERLPPPAAARRWNMRRLHAWVLERQGYWPRELALMRQKLRAELDSDGAPTALP